MAVISFLYSYNHANSRGKLKMTFPSNVRQLPTIMDIQLYVHHWLPRSVLVYYR